jgi:hypothetical protein
MRWQVDAEELVDEELTAGSSGHAARRSGSSDPVSSAARARMSQRGRLGRRGAAGRRTGPAEIKASSDGRGALTHWMVAAVQGYIQWTWREPAGGVMNRLRCGRSSDSDGRSLNLDRTTCRAASLDCSEWSGERDTGRGRLDQVEGGDSRRTGPSRITIQDVPLEVGHA